MPWQFLAAALVLVGACGGDDAATTVAPLCSSQERSRPGFVCEGGEFVACADATSNPIRLDCSHCGCPGQAVCNEELNRCVGQAAPGEACEDDYDCASLNCRSTEPRTCLVPLGGPCTADDCERCFEGAEGDSYCSKPCSSDGVCKRREQVCDGAQCVPNCCDRSWEGGDCPRKACPAGFDDDIHYMPTQEPNGGWAATPFCTCELDFGHFDVAEPTPSGDGGSDAGIDGGPAGDRRYTFINTYANQSCAIRDDHSLVCWGAPLLDSFTMRSLTAYDRDADLMCGIQPDGRAVCESARPDAEAYLRLEVPSGSFDALSIEARFVCGLNSSGSANCWGDPAHPVTRQSPQFVFIALATGSTSACGVDFEGAVRCWGDLEVVGNPPTGAFIDIDGDDQTFCAVQQDGAVQCWGQYQDLLVPSAGSAFRSVRVHGSTACGITQDGALACFGLVTGDAPPTGSFSSLSITSTHGCALDDVGVAHCWYLTSNRSPSVTRALDAPLP